MPADPAKHNDTNFHSVKGEEWYNIESLKDIHVTAGHDEKINITHDRTINVDGKHTETIKGDTTIKITEGKLDHAVQKTAQYAVTGAVTEIYGDTQHTEVKNEIAIHSEMANICLQGQTYINIYVGDNQIWIGSDGNIGIKAKASIGLNVGKNSLVIDSNGNIAINAETSILLKAGGSSITMDQSGITLTGLNINLNC